MDTIANLITPTLLLGMAAVGAAGVISGLTGFGFALVTVPILVIFLPPKTVVPVVMILSNLTHALVLVETWKWMDLKRIWPLVLTGVAGIPLGTYLLVILDATTLKVLIGAVTILAALAMLVGFKRTVRNERLAFVPVGFASGLLSGSTAMGGPPVVLFFSNQGVEKQVCRANFTLLFTVLSLVSVPAQIAGRLITEPVLIYSAAFAPALLIGSIIGIRLARVMSETLFRKLTLIIIIVTGLSAVAAGLGIL